MKKIFSKLFVLMMLVCFCFLTFSINVHASEKSDDIIILYENDVHSAVEGYSKLSAMKKELLEQHNYVGVVSSGDFIQGGTLAAASRGSYIVELMNLVGYDAVTLGNHEFDYELERLLELVELMNTKPVCSNFSEIGKDTPVFDPYVIKTYGDIDIAYIGITTPETLTTSSPAQFKDENGDYIYTFNQNNEENNTKLYDTVQENIDKAYLDGAEYVIALTHVGYSETGDFEDVTDLVENVSGLNVVLDAHSHSVIEGMNVVDKDGDNVLVSSTGTKFEHIGKLTISNGEFKTELIKTEEYTKTDPVVDECITKITEEQAVVGNRVIGEAEVDLFCNNEEGVRLIRTEQTNLGDLCAKAFREIGNADIGLVNGGGIRSDLKKGEITFNDLLSVFPYENSLAVVEVSGQVIKDALEMALSKYPDENGGFFQVSGIRFRVNKSIPSSVVKAEDGSFVKVDGEYRVYNLEVYNKEEKIYEVLKLDSMYTVASIDFLVLNGGDGMSMFKDAKKLECNDLLGVEVLEKYIKENLNGKVDKSFEKALELINFTEEFETFHKVTYVVNGEIVREIYVRDGGNGSAPNIPSKEGYYAYWNHNGKNIKSDLIISNYYVKRGINGWSGNVLRYVYIGCLVLGAGALITLLVVRAKKNKIKG